MIIILEVPCGLNSDSVKQNQIFAYDLLTERNYAKPGIAAVLISYKFICF